MVGPTSTHPLDGASCRHSCSNITCIRTRDLRRSGCRYEPLQFYRRALCDLRRHRRQRDRSTPNYSSKTPHASDTGPQTTAPVWVIADNAVARHPGRTYCSHWQEPVRGRVASRDQLYRIIFLPGQHHRDAQCCTRFIASHRDTPPAPHPLFIRRRRRLGFHHRS